MMLSIVIIDLDDAKSVSVEKLWVLPIPTVFVNVTPSPASASDLPTATLNVSSVNLMA